MSVDFETAGFERAIARLPRWILALAVAGTLFTLVRYGVRTGGVFLLGSIAAWVNLWLVERAARRVTTPDSDVAAPAGKTAGKRLFFQFAALLIGAFVIIYLSGFSQAGAFCGFLVCPAAVMLEIVYELFTLKR